MVTNELVEAETQSRRRVAVIAALAAILSVGPPVLAQALVGTDPVDNALSQSLQRVDNREALFLSTGLTLLGLLGITYLLDYLLRAARARDATIQPYVRILVIAGGVGMVVFQAVLQITTAIRLDHWATQTTLTWDELRDASNLGAFLFVGLAVQLAFAFGFVLVSLNAMRAGLLTRFLGYLGVISAVLFVLMVLPLPIVQAFWLANVALLLWNIRGPREPPAWQSGEAVAWPSAADVREQRVRAAEARRAEAGPEAVRQPLFGRRKAEPEAEVAPDVFEGDESAADGETDAAGRPVPEHARRKRKKRR